MSTTELTLEFFIAPEKAGQYLTLPFTMPENIAELRLSYHYPRHQETAEEIPGGNFTRKEGINIIDLGLVAPDGTQAGASGSNKNSIFISPTQATPGYTPQPLTPGEWHIIVGAYKVAPEGVTVTYEINFIPKQRRLLIGDLHTHTVDSDGVLTFNELACHARRQGLDFLGITNHNHIIPQAVLNLNPELTLIAGLEWTHYRGHANFLGVDHPYDEPFFTNTDEDMQARFKSARDSGALIVINHPFGEGCEFQFDLADLHFDALEIWNGPMRESNMKAIALWHSMLSAGRKVPAVGGSDYHADNLFQILGGPCMGVYAQSDTPADILAAVAAGHSFITFAPRGLVLDMRAGAAEMGDTVAWEDGLAVEITIEGLIAGDTVSVIEGTDFSDLFKADGEGKVTLTYPVAGPGFVRVEVQRNFVPGVPPLPALIGNPIYFS